MSHGVQHREQGGAVLVFAKNMAVVRYGIHVAQVVQRESGLIAVSITNHAMYARIPPPIFL